MRVTGAGSPYPSPPPRPARWRPPPCQPVGWPRWALALAASWGLLASVVAEEVPVPPNRVRLEGTIVDVQDGAPLPARLHVTSKETGQSFVVRSASPEGSAAPYDRRSRESVEVHTALSAHPFTVDLPPGHYTLTAERGKEYVPAEVTLTLEKEPVKTQLVLRRWIHMAERGWWSGDTHTHRLPEELPTVLLAEDLNAAFPLVQWVTRAFVAPASGDKTSSNLPGASDSAANGGAPEAHYVDAAHGWWPLNTEYELFTVDGKRHELGAVFILGHREPFSVGVPPIEPLRAAARAQRALFELDKHCWPWSMAIVPILDVDLYELTNNHLWRAPFAFTGWGEAAAPYMNVERTDAGWTERGWIDFGLQNYYALLDCGFRLRPTAGTASGVHPVPLGFGRVYVQLDGPFKIEAWLEALDAGRSFVTTGPMLLAETSIQRGDDDAPRSVTVRGAVESLDPVTSIELVVNGHLQAIAVPPERVSDGGVRELPFRATLRVEGSSWIAVRVFTETPSGRPRFAHTAPVHIDVPGKPLVPRKVEVEYLVKRVREQIERSRGVLPPEAIAEYERALAAYERLLPGVRQR